MKSIPAHRAVLLALSCACASTALAASPPATDSLPTPTFDVKHWVETAGKVSIEDWCQRHPPVLSGYGLYNKPDALNYIVTWGPLGIRTRMYSVEMGADAWLKSMWPLPFVDKRGRLAVNCFEVIEILPDAPAAGHLQVGDFLIAMDGQPFQDAEALYPERKTSGGGVRFLEMQAGELLDLAEGRGRVKFSVLRMPYKQVAVTPDLQAKPMAVRQLDVDVSGASEVRISAEGTSAGPAKTNQAAEVLNLRLEGPSGTLDLMQDSLFQAYKVELLPGRALEWWHSGVLNQDGARVTRYAIPVTLGKDAFGQPVLKDGKPVAAVFGLGSGGSVRYQIPPGYTRLRGEVQGAKEGTGIAVKVEVRERVKLDQPLSVAKELCTTGELRAPFWKTGVKEQAELKAKVTPGGSMRLVFGGTPRRKGEEQYHPFHGALLNVINPVLTGPAGTLDLSQVEPKMETKGEFARKLPKRGLGWLDQPIKENGVAVPASFAVIGNCILEYAVPSGYTDFHATVQVGQEQNIGMEARVEIEPKHYELPSAFNAFKREVSFDIPKLGSYGENFSAKNNEKSRNVAAMTAAWLASQQLPDGSWPNKGGSYENRTYDTAWAGLGLLAQNDPAYDANIRKAAEFCALSGTTPGWSVCVGSDSIFLSEYWLRTHDDRVLPTMHALVEMMQNKMVQGDFTAGHGAHPGYSGGGVSTGGAHIALALAVSNLTPVKPDDLMLRRMLARAQEIAPGGVVPYGRGGLDRHFAPNPGAAGCGSGKSGPYLVASCIYGGPRLYTEIAKQNYALSAGREDAAHATQTLSLMWAFPAALMAGDAAYHKHLDAMRWKLTMLRCHDGAFTYNPNVLDSQIAENMLHAYLRCGCWLVALNGDRRNLAITGAPQWQAKTFMDVLPTPNLDATIIGYHQRNWGVADAALGAQSPPLLREKLRAFLALQRGEGNQKRLFDFLKDNGPAVAAEILKLKTVDPLLRHHAAEMVLGMDMRLTLNSSPDGKAKKYAITLEEQQPLAGYTYLDAMTEAEKAAWIAHPTLPLSGTVALVNTRDPAMKPVVFTLLGRHPGGQWGRFKQTQSVSLPAPETTPGKVAVGPDWVARFHYQVAGMTFDYERPVQADVNGGGMRVVWVPGRMAPDYHVWNASFTLPSGQFISAAQWQEGVGLRLWQPAKAGGWERMPADLIVPKGTDCVFGYTSDIWLEANMADLRVPKPNQLLVRPVQTLINDKPVADLGDKWLDGNPQTFLEIPYRADKTAAVECRFAKPERVRLIHLCGTDRTFSLSAMVDGKWEKVLYGNGGNRKFQFSPVTTDRLRVEFFDGKFPDKTYLSEFLIYRAQEESQPAK